MFRDHDQLDTTELEINSIDMLNKVLVTLEENLISIKQHCKEETAKIDHKNRNSSVKSKLAIYDMMQSFHRQLTIDLTELQGMCLEHKIHGLLALATEEKLRLKPASYKAYTKDLKKLSSNVMNFRKRSPGEPKTYEPCSCHWTNIPESELEPTQDILKRPIKPLRTAFDTSDLKFKQEVALLRTKLFTFPEYNSKRRKISGFDRASSLLAEMKAGSSKIAFRESIENSGSYGAGQVNEELAKIGSLKFVDGEFKHCELWRKMLDCFGNQLRSKWLLVLRPQVEALLKKHLVSSAHLSSEKVFALLSQIGENGSTYTLYKTDVLYLLENNSQAAECLMDWRIQFSGLTGIQVAATTIQRYWKGYSVRRDIRESDCKYIAASIIWMAWLLLKKTRYMHAKYLSKMLVAMSSTEQLNSQLSARYQETINAPHIVIHLSSLGLPLDIRKSVSPPIFRIYQNVLALKMSFVRNPNAVVIYILPVEASESLLQMYYDILESICPNQGVQKRIHFLRLSMNHAFSKNSFNAARTLYYSDYTMETLSKKITGKPAYILPWVMDECDVWAAGMLGIPWIGASLSLQSWLMNKSNTAEILTKFNVAQPPYSSNVKDYTSLCVQLAELICCHSEISLWLMKINMGMDGKQTGVFLINNTSVPFMLELRKARERSGVEWNSTFHLRHKFRERLLAHLPEVVYAMTRLSANYKSWKDFNASIVKHGCLIQAVPNERIFSVISSAVFIPGRDTRTKPVCFGTVDQMHLETQFTAFGFMMPQTSFPNEDLQLSVIALANHLQEMGYFGYASFDCFCYIRKSDDLPVVLIVDIDPYYGKVHTFLDWFCFTINGKYDPEDNSFQSDVEVSAEARKKFYHPDSKVGRWDESSRRFGVAMGRLHHTHLYRQCWPKLYYFGKKCKISYNAKTRVGSHVAFHDGESRAHVMMTSCHVTMKQCLQAVTANLKNLSKALTTRYHGAVETNISAAAEYLATLTANYKSVNRDECARGK